MKDCIGVVGLGLLGAALARRLVAAGHAVLGWDIDPGKAGALAGVGIRAATPPEMAEHCSCVVVAVFTACQAAEVLESLTAAAGAAGRQRTLVCTTTCPPDAAIGLGRAAAAAGWHFVEAPVSGTSAQVLAGEATGIAAGTPQALAHAQAVLAAFCQRWHYLAKAGDAARAKLAVNLVLGLNRLALAEGLVFAERQGLDGPGFLELLRGSAAYSQTMDTKGKKMLGQHYAPEGKAEQALKDAALMQEEATRMGISLRMLDVYAATLASCIAHGEGSLDSSVVAEEVRRRANARA